MEDPLSYLWYTFFIVLLIMISGFFSASETALTSVSRHRLRLLAKSKEEQEEEEDEEEAPKGEGGGRRLNLDLDNIPEKEREIWRKVLDMDEP